MPAITVQTKNLYIQHGHQLILREINLTLHAGDFVYLMGKTGSGKSSFLRTLYADLPIYQGQVWVGAYQLHRLEPKNIPFLRREIGIVFQNFQLLWDRSVYRNLEFVLRATDWTDQTKIDRRIDEVLEMVGLTHKRDTMPHLLSGGEQQRVGIARALLNHARLIIADEPTGNLDLETSHSIIQLLYDLAQKGCTVIIATHHQELTQQFPGKILACKDHQIQFQTQLIEQEKNEPEYWNF